MTRWWHVVLGSVLLASPAAAEDWPQWLGPRRDGSSQEPVPVWRQPPAVLWRQPVGEGHSSPVVAGGRVYLFTQTPGKEEEVLTAYEARQGTLLWQQRYPRRPFRSQFGTGPRATPAVAEGRVYTFGVTGVLSCFAAATGQRFWQVDTLERLRAPNLFFGVSCSPLVADGRVYVNVGGKGASLVAFAAESGQVVWQALEDRASYASPLLGEVAGRRQVVFLTQEGLVAVDPAKGDLLWRFPFRDALLESSVTPVQAGSLFVVSSITAGTAAVSVRLQGERFQVVTRWKQPGLTGYFTTPVVIGDYLYLVTGTNPLSLKLLAGQRPQATLHCVDLAEGKERWRKEGVGAYHAALLRTGDGKLLLLQDSGELVLVQPDPQQYREVARARVCGATWAHPALAEGRLYLRDQRELLCLALRP